MSTSRPTITTVCQLISRTQNLKRSSIKLFNHGSHINYHVNRQFSGTTDPLFVSFSYFCGSNNGSRRAAGARQRQVGETTILVQDGLDIQEVPVAVLKSDPCKADDGKQGAQLNSYIKLEAKEEAAFVDGFSNFNSPREILRMLDTIPSQEVTPIVSLSILRKLFQLENNFGFRNDGKSWVISADNSALETFARTAIVSRLIDIIISAEDSTVLVDTLDVLRQEKRVPQSPQPWFGQIGTPSLESLEDYSSYCNRLCNEVLVRTTEGRLDLENVCRAVSCLGLMDLASPNNNQKRFIDKMWGGILSKSGDITEKNIVKVFSTIPYFTKARRLVMNLVERKIISLCWKMDNAAVADICKILIENEKRTRSYLNLSEDWGLSHRFLICLTRCTSLNLHLVTEEQLSTIVHGFLAMDYFDSSIEKVLNKYMKAKSRKVSDPNLVASIMTFVKQFRLRSSSNIMEGAGEYFIQHGPQLTASQIYSTLLPFGLLDFQPPNGPKFWETVETVLRDKFVQFSPTDIIDILLTCVFLQKYPLNFVDRVFSPYFLDRLHTSEPDFNTLQKTRSRLKLLDTALTLECPAKYNGPILPRDFTAKSLYLDPRIYRMRRKLEEFLYAIFPSSGFKIEIGTPVPNLPLNELYIIDFIITLKNSSRSLNQTQTQSLSQLQENNDGAKKEGDERDDEDKTQAPAQLSLRNRINLKYSGAGDPQCRDAIAVLINIPEHFSADGKHLTGPQVMRLRHMKILGFQVFTFKYETLTQLYPTPQALLNYLKESFSSVQTKGANSP